MTRTIFVYEHLTGGGLLGEPLAATANLAALSAEGAAMLQGLCQDLAQILDLEVDVLVDHRLSELQLAGCRRVEIQAAEQLLTELLSRAKRAAGAIVIAPEFDGLLVRLLKQIEAAGGKLIGPGWQFAQLASFKHLAAEQWQRDGIPVPPGTTIQPGVTLPTDLTLPVVVKPDDGAGSDVIGHRPPSPPRPSPAPPPDARQRRRSPTPPADRSPPPASTGTVRESAAPR